MPIIGIVLLALALFCPVLFQGKFMLPIDMFDTMILPFSTSYGPPQAYNPHLTDAVMQSYPWKVYEQDALVRGSVAYWNPAILGGYPQYASSRQTFDVFNLLLLAVPLPLAFHLIIVLQITLAGIGMYLLLRSESISRGVATLFGIAWMLNGMFLTHAENLWVTACFCWVPFVVRSLAAYFRTRRLKDLALAAIFLALAFLASTLQSAVFVVFIVAFSSFFFARQSQLGLGRWMLSMGVLVAVAIAASAMMWLPSLELFHHVIKEGSLFSPTHDAPYTLVRRLGSVLLLITFFIPELLGHGRSLSLHSTFSLHPLDFSGYFGFVEMACTVAAVLLWRRAPERIRGYIALTVLGLTLPVFTPLFAWLYHRFFIVATFGGVVSGAWFCERLLSREIDPTHVKRFLRWSTGLAIVLFASVAIANLAFVLKPTLHSSFVQTMIERSQHRPYADGNDPWVMSRIQGTLSHYSLLSPTMIVPFVVVAVSLWALWRFVKGSDSKRTIYILIAMSAVQSFFWWRDWTPMLDPAQFPLYPETPTIEKLKTELDTEHKFYPFRVLSEGKQYLFLDNLPSMYGIREPAGYESEVTRNFYKILGERVTVDQPHAAFLGLLGVHVLMTPDIALNDTNLVAFDTGRVRSYLNKRWLPRARLVYSTQTTGCDSDVVQVLVESPSAAQSAFFTKADRPSHELHDSATWSQATVTVDQNELVRVHAAPNRPSYLILNDSYYPGWRCSVDGQPAEIERANFAMRAVFLPAGDHTIEFRFDPASFATGKWISVIMSLTLMVTVASGHLRSRRKRR